METKTKIVTRLTLGKQVMMFGHVTTFQDRMSKT